MADIPNLEPLVLFQCINVDFRDQWHCQAVRRIRDFNPLMRDQARIGAGCGRTRRRIQRRTEEDVLNCSCAVGAQILSELRCYGTQCSISQYCEGRVWQLTGYLLLLTVPWQSDGHFNRYLGEANGTNFPIHARTDTEQLRGPALY